tara:strand:+ start:23 stop:235 length:213 start_codon:yes stop_codon:yes gene_type:complete
MKNQNKCNEKTTSINAPQFLNIKNCDNIDYIEDVIGGEIELWGCKDCKKSFQVSIEIVRDFANAEVSDEK